MMAVQAQKIPKGITVETIVVENNSQAVQKDSIGVVE
jgi:hypothetical protein